MNQSILENVIQWRGDFLRLLDQRKLPHRLCYVDCRQTLDIAQAITEMTVRGAPAIGITAAYGVVLAAKTRIEAGEQNWQQNLEQDLEMLAAARPTAVNLAWAIDRMRKCLVNNDDPIAGLLHEAQSIHEHERSANRKMAEMAMELISANSAVLTHCNTGALATGAYGTALGVIRHGYKSGKITRVFADETRPWLQGSRLTAWELLQDDIPVTLIADGAAAYLMQTGKIHWLIVGADRIMANGDAANKIGTYHAAIAARYHGVRVMVVAPTSTVDLGLASGQQVEIEQRDPKEILSYGQNRIAAEGAQAWNPVFDVTPHSLIDAIVTEKGVVIEPNSKKIAAMMANP